MRYSELPSMPLQPMGEQLPLERISPRPSLQRGQEYASLEALAESIRRYGLIRPVTVRRTGTGHYVVISGNRRLMACRMLGMTSIPVRIFADDARWQPAERLLDALLTRRMHYLEEAEALQALHDVHGIAWTELSRTLGLSETLLCQQGEMALIADDLRALLLEEGVPLSIAMLLMRLTDVGKRMAVAQRIVQERLCIRDSGLLVSAALRYGREEPKREKKMETDEKSKRAKENQTEEPSAPGQGVLPPWGTRRVIGVIRDHRLYLNAIRDIAGQMKAAGLAATLAERQVGGEMELTLRVPVRRRRVERYQSM